MNYKSVSVLSSFLLSHCYYYFVAIIKIQYHFRQSFLFKCCGFPTAILSIWCFHVHFTVLSVLSSSLGVSLCACKYLN